ncbi:MAG: hypothetical protein JWM53_2141 [bacterium]|nr:hypothetical protein [bacterium]
MRVVLVGLTVLVAACAPRNAVVRGRDLPRVTADYTDHRVYALTHHAAYPEARGPSSGLHEYAGRLAGRVCGNEVWLEADYRGRYMQLTGFYEPNDGARHTTNQVQLEVRDYGGERHIRGSIGAGQVPTVGWAGVLSGVGDSAGRIIGDFSVHEGDHIIDLSYNSGRLYGSLNGRLFALQVDGDDALAGTVIVAGSARDFTLHGVSRLWAMPVADQAAILPMLLSCKYDDRDPMPAGVTHLQLAPTLTMSGVRQH